ncbi:MAG: hypothetical protein PUE12_09425, partial [Oscillospiraceae bacterium]|nr:hypothetical protein [Oscillospiraceae bacterium]
EKYEEEIKKHVEEKEKYKEEREKYKEKIKKHDEEKINNVLNMLSDNNSDDLIIRYTGVTPAELAEIKAKFNR